MSIIGTCVFWDTTIHYRNSDGTVEVHLSDGVGGASIDVTMDPIQFAAYMHCHFHPDGWVDENTKLAEVSNIIRDAFESKYPGELDNPFDI